MNQRDANSRLNPKGERCARSITNNSSRLKTSGTAHGSLPLACGASRPEMTVPWGLFSRGLDEHGGYWSRYPGMVGPCSQARAGSGTEMPVGLGDAIILHDWES